MLKKEAKELLKQKDKEIEKIREEQLQILAKCVKDTHNLEIKDIIIIKGYTVVVTGFVVNTDAKIIRLCYRRINYNGNLESAEHTTAIPNKIQKQGVYNRKL